MTPLEVALRVTGLLQRAIFWSHPCQTITFPNSQFAIRHSQFPALLPCSPLPRSLQDVLAQVLVPGDLLQHRRT